MMPKWVQKLLWRMLLDGKALEFPAPGLIVEDAVTKDLDTGSVFYRVSSNGRGVYFPKFRFLVAPNAVDTAIRTPEEVANRIISKPRTINLLVHKPRSEVSEFVRGFGEPVVCYNDIVRAVTPKGFSPHYKRLYVRAEDDLIRAALENGHSPIVVRFGGTKVTRARYIRLAREYYGVSVRVYVFPSPGEYTPTKFERRVFKSWEDPDVAEGFEDVVWLTK